MTLELQTDRLVLRPQTAADIDAIEAGLADFEVARHLTVVPFPYTRRDAEEWVARLTPPTTERAIFSVVLPGSGMIGTVTIADELGYWLASPYWGRGYMTEAARSLIAWYFRESGAGALRSSAHAENARSLAVQKKLGFIEIGRGTRFVRSVGRDLDHVDTRLTRRAFDDAIGGRS